MCPTPGCYLPDGCPHGLARNKYGCITCECAGEYCVKCASVINRGYLTIKVENTGLKIMNEIVFHNTPLSYLPKCTSSPPPPKFCITFLFHFPWVLQPSHEKLKTMLMQNFGGQIRYIMGDVQVAYRHTQEVPSLGLISQRPSF